MEGEALVPIEPSAHLGMLVGGVIVEDHMHGFAGRNFRLDGVEETNELLMPVALHVAADHRTVENVQRGEERRRAMPLVVMRHRADASPLQRQSGLGAVKRLDLALFVYRQNNRVRRRIDLEAYPIAPL